jgi:hypothetical protein
MKFAFVVLFWLTLAATYWGWQRQRCPADPTNWTLAQWGRAGWSGLTLAALAAIAVAVVASFAWCLQ